jgi:Transport and Golgi organisation 2
VCTVVVSFAPGKPAPVLLVGVRDEFAARPWRPPGRHWPDLPVTGGLDVQAGGTWLAVNDSVPRAACILNGWGGALVPPGRRRSRGDLPLRAAAGGLDAVQKLLSERATLERYDAFHLVVAEPSSVTVLSWDGATLTRTGPGLGTHLYTNAGHAYPAAQASSGGAPPPRPVPADRGHREPRAGYFGPRFAARRPSGDPRRSLAGAWDGWLDLVAGDGLDATDPRALIVRRELPDGRVWGSSSVSLVSLAPGGGDPVRYDFRALPGGTVPGDAVPGDAVPGAAGFAWRTVLP